MLVSGHQRPARATAKLKHRYPGFGELAIAAVLLALLAVLSATTASAQRLLVQSGEARKPSTCLAVAENRHGPRMEKASLRTVSEDRFAVNIRFATHSTYRITTPEDVVIATDFAGTAGSGRLPDIVTMNHAHGMHYTNNPDPSISHVLRGWSENGQPREHYLEYRDVLVRNVPTDLYRGGVVMEENGNSIFIFEVAGLCIAHLGHLHHLLSPEQFADVGRIDVLMVAIPRSNWMLSIQGLSETAKRFRSSVVLPMHWNSSFAVDRFTADMAGDFAIDRRENSDINVSLRTLPEQPTVIVLQPELGGGFGFGWQDP